MSNKNIKKNLTYNSPSKKKIFKKKNAHNNISMEDKRNTIFYRKMTTSMMYLHIRDMIVK